MTEQEREVIAEKVFEMLAYEKGTDEIRQATGIKDLEVISSNYSDKPIIATIHYPDGEKISHWL